MLPEEDAAVAASNAGRRVTSGVRRAVAVRVGR